MTYQLLAGAPLDSGNIFKLPAIDGGPFVNNDYPYLVVSHIDGGFFTDGSGLLVDGGSIPLYGTSTYDPTHVYGPNDILLPPPPPPPPPPIINTSPTVLTVTVESIAHAGTTRTVSWTTANSTYVTTNVTTGNQSANGSASFTVPSQIGYYAVIVTAFNVNGDSGQGNGVYAVIGPPSVRLKLSPSGIKLGESITIFWDATNATKVVVNEVTGEQLPQYYAVITPSTRGTYTVTAIAYSELSSETLTSNTAIATYTVA